MKKSLIIFVIFLFTSSTVAFAQFSAGLKGGAELSTLRRDGNLNLNGGRVGYLVGIYGKMYMGELGWFFQPEIQYTSQGDNAQKLQYLEIPLILGFDVSEGINVHGGYNLGILLGGDDLGENAYKSTNNIISFGMEFKGFKNGMFGIRLNYGLSNIVEDPAQVRNFEAYTVSTSMYLLFKLMGKTAE